MIRITKNNSRISSIKAGQEEIDSFVLIPGITLYQGIFSKKNTLWFLSTNHLHTLSVEFVNEGELDRFFIQLMREIKLNQITNVNVDTKTK